MDVTTGALAADNERNLWASRERPFLAIATKHTNVGNPPDVVRIPVHSRLCTEEDAAINFELATKLEDLMPTCVQWIGTHNTPLCVCLCVFGAHSLFCQDAVQIKGLSEHNMYEERNIGSLMRTIVPKFFWSGWQSPPVADEVHIRYPFAILPLLIHSRSMLSA